jgi:hypothetical protein
MKDELHYSIICISILKMLILNNYISLKTSWQLSWHKLSSIHNPDLKSEHKMQYKSVK